MTTEQIAAAVWCENGPGTMVLKARVKDGGAVLASVQERGPAGYSDSFAWQAGARSEFAATRYAAQRAARKALKEASS